MLSILVVDDNAINATVRVAGNAAEAVHELRSLRPDVLLLDVQLPGVDGLTLLTRLRDDPHWRDLPIAMVTSYASAIDEERARAAGCDAFVSKPIDTRTIGDLVLNLAQRPS
jgi:CheY-like chemotaxis protein